MQITTVRSIDPDHMQVTVEIVALDVDAAFTSQTDPDEVLFYNLFGPGWDKLTSSEKMTALSALAAILERASALEVAFAPPVLKS